MLSWLMVYVYMRESGEELIINLSISESYSEHVLTCTISSKMHVFKNLFIFTNLYKIFNIKIE